MCAPEDESVDSAKLQSAMQHLTDALNDPKTPDDEEDGIRFAWARCARRWPASGKPLMMQKLQMSDTHLKLVQPTKAGRRRPIDGAKQ